MSEVNAAAAGVNFLPLSFYYLDVMLGISAQSSRIGRMCMAEASMPKIT